jgi:uncharacterized protein (DUF1778 family)
MAEENRKRRGGSDSARENGLTGIVVHVTPEQRRRIGAAASLAGDGSVKAFVARAALELTERILKKEREGID